MAQQQQLRSDLSFYPPSAVKGLRFGGQLMVKSFKIRRAGIMEFNRLICSESESPTTTAFIPTNFSVLAQRAWHTVTLGLGTKKSKVVVFVFESEQLKHAITKTWAWELALGDVNRKLIRGISGCEMARFKFRKGALTFYVYAVRRQGTGQGSGFQRAEELKSLLQSIIVLKDFVDHTALLASPQNKAISYSAPVAVAH